ncbi:TonB-dependent receptor domain-containing protein [Shinella sp. BYT-45]|uniref:TonB-dependent receptor n=1 Tax=Shinella sp. BYT-45 TaxID=3377377 RepID=UPI00397FAEB6
MTSRNRIFRRKARASLLALLLSGAATAVLPVRAEAQQPRIAVDLPAGNLAGALNRLASQSGLQMVFDASVAGGLTSARVSGNMTATEALERLLAGTGIRYRFIGERTVKVEVAADAASGSSAAAADDGTALQAIVVKGGRVFNGDAPSVAEIDSEEIEAAQANSLPQLLRRTPGVNAGGGVRLQGQTLAIRGFARASDVRILLDGAPKNFERYDQGTVFVDPELLKRVEILKGATSVRYGNGGFGGTVLMESKTAADMLKEGQTLGAWTKTSYQSANKQRLGSAAVYGKSDFGGPVTYDGLASVIWRKSDNMRVGGGKVYDASNDRLLSFSANAGAELDGHELRASVVYGKSEDWGPPAGVRGDLGLTAYTIDRYGYELARLRALALRDMEDFSSTLKYSYLGDSDLVNFKAMASLSSTGLNMTRPTVAGFTPSATIGGQEDDVQYTDIKLEAENTSSFELGGLSHVANYGVQFVRHERDSWMYDIANRNSAQHNYGYYASWIVPEGTQQTISAFLRDEIGLTDTFKVTPGLRFDHVRSKGVPNAAPRYNDPAAGHDYSAVSHTGLTPALSLRWEATPATTLFADWAYAMRAPVIDEIYSSQSALTSASATSRGLKAERNNNISLGVSQQFDDVLRNGDTLVASLSAFHNHVTNPVTRRFGAANLAGVKGVPFYWNTPSYRVYGLELTARYDSDTLFGDLGVSWMNGRRHGAINNIYGPDTYTQDLAPLTANVQIGYRVADHDLSFSWNGLFVARQHRTPARQGGETYARRESSGYAVHGLSIDWTPQEGPLAGLEVHAAVDNLFDKYYFPYLSDGISAMPGRSFKLSVSRKF